MLWEIFLLVLHVGDLVLAARGISEPGKIFLRFSEIFSGRSGIFLPSEWLELLLCTVSSVFRQFQKKCLTGVPPR